MADMSAEKKVMNMRWSDHMAIRALTAVVVTVFIFWCGFEFGEIRASVDLGQGYIYHVVQSGLDRGTIYGYGTLPSISPTPVNMQTSAAASASAGVPTPTAPHGQ